MPITLQGFHGTSYRNAKIIMHSSFNPSYGDEEWLGDGVYFFTKGLSNKPHKQAIEWAKAQSWCKKAKTYLYKRIGVIKCDINVEEKNLLDLTTSDGVDLLNYIIECHSKKIKETGKKLSYIDGFVINFARSENILPIEVVKGNVYIKFSTERINDIRRRTSNCTICAVNDPSKNITSKSIELTTTI